MNLFAGQYSHRRDFIGIAILGLLCNGCGSGEILVQGKVTKGGVPLIIGKDDSLEVTFVPLEGEKAGQGDSHAAKTDAKEGTFTVLGIRRRGIPPGKYRIDVQVVPNRGPDRLEGKFSGPKSPIVRTVSSSEELVIDLDRPAE